MPSPSLEFRLRRQIEKAAKTSFAARGSAFSASGRGDLPDLGHSPAAVLAALLLARMFDAEPGLREAILTRQPIITLQAPSAAWTLKVRAVIRRVLDGALLTFSGTGKRSSSHDADRLRLLSEDGPSKGWAVVDDEDPDWGRWLRYGHPVIALWHTNEFSLPSPIQRLRTHAVTLPRLDQTLVRWLVATSTQGTCDLPLFTVDVARLEPHEIEFSVVPGLAAAECVRRLASFADARAESARARLTLADLHGLEGARLWGERLARDLQDYRNQRIPWSAVDQGAVLTGPPGTGKTMFARALANTCRVPLVATSVAQWNASDHLGKTLQAMRDSFAAAARQRPAILFIDEIDGIGDRSTFSEHDRAYCVQIVNGLLECVDGQNRREGVVVIGACNNADAVDPALKRPGRLDREIAVTLPGPAALAGIYRFHLGDDLPGLDLEPLAAISCGASGADVELFVRSARRTARHAGRELHLEDLVAEVRGPLADLPVDLRHRIAVHEAGHAIAAVRLGLSNTVSVSILARGTTLGITSFERPARPLQTQATGRLMLAYILAGRAAEDILLGSPSSGSGGRADSDLAQATMMAAQLEGSYGLGDTGILTWHGEPGQHASLMREPRLRRAVDQTLATIYAEVRTLLAAQRQPLARVACALETHLHLSARELFTLIHELPEVEDAPRPA